MRRLSIVYLLSSVLCLFAIGESCGLRSVVFAQETPGFDFSRAAQVEKALPAAADSLHQAASLPRVLFFLPAFLFIMALVIVFLFWRWAKNKEIAAGLSLANLPTSAKLLLTYVLSIYGLVHIAALINVFVKTNIAYKSVKEYFYYLPLEKLVATMHSHLFGHTTMYAISAGIFLFTRLREKAKIAVISLLFFGSTLDLYSWWLIKYVSPGFEALSIISAAMFCPAFLFIWLCVMRELWEPCLRPGGKNGKSYHLAL